MNKWFVKTENNITFSDVSFVENGQESVPFEVSEEDLAKVQTGDWKFNIEGETLSVVYDEEKVKAREAEKAAQEEAISAKKRRKTELILKEARGEKLSDSEFEELSNLV